MKHLGRWLHYSGHLTKNSILHRPFDVYGIMLQHGGGRYHKTASEISNIENFILPNFRSDRKIVTIALCSIWISILILAGQNKWWLSSQLVKCRTVYSLPGIIVLVVPFSIVPFHGICITLFMIGPIYFDSCSLRYALYRFRSVLVLGYPSSRTLSTAHRSYLIYNLIALIRSSRDNMRTPSPLK